MSDPKKILVIRLKQIGDALLSIPVCNSLRATYPNAQIDYLVYEHIVPILENQPAINNVLAITPQERKSKRLYFKKIWTLRKANYDMVIDLINVPISAVTTFLSGADYTIGFDKKRWRSKLYKTSVPHRDYGDTVTKKLDILQGLPRLATVDRHWRLPVTSEELEAVKAVLLKQGVNFAEPMTFVAASSRRNDKLWPDAYMLKVLNHLQRKHKSQLIFNWVPGDEGEMAERLAAQLNSQQGVFANIDLRLNQLPVAISLCDFFFGNDGGPHHMAVGTDVPSLAVYPPFHSKESWLPLDAPRHQGYDLKDAMQLDHAGWKALQKDIKTDLAGFYSRLKPELVIAKLDQLWEDQVNV